MSDDTKANDSTSGPIDTPEFRELCSAVRVAERRANRTARNAEAAAGELAAAKAALNEYLTAR